ncbi:hypothetical protein FKW77_003577 [Venturia effusa]|uniref:Uncharacterized protein n=1 Tax=Venturia effusa TaxID=50376 RepID=A0A517LL84_9PEZI|nr:hypothetical protein FKW77_003577 [Venturia effusa]
MADSNFNSKNSGPGQDGRDIVDYTDSGRTLYLPYDYVGQDSAHGDIYYSGLSTSNPRHRPSLSLEHQQSHYFHHQTDRPSPQPGAYLPLGQGPFSYPQQGYATPSIDPPLYTPFYSDPLVGAPQQQQPHHQVRSSLHYILPGQAFSQDAPQRFVSSQFQQAHETSHSTHADDIYNDFMSYFQGSSPAMTSQQQEPPHRSHVSQFYSPLAEEGSPYAQEPSLLQHHPQDHISSKPISEETRALQTVIENIGRWWDVDGVDDFSRCPEARWPEEKIPHKLPNTTGPMPERLCFNFHHDATGPSALLPEDLTMKMCSPRNLAEWHRSGYDYRTIARQVATNLSADDQNSHAHALRMRAGRWFEKNGVHASNNTIRSLRLQYVVPLIMLSTAQLFFGIIGDPVVDDFKYGIYQMTPPRDRWQGTPGMTRSVTPYPVPRMFIRRLGVLLQSREGYSLPTSSLCRGIFIPLVLVKLYPSLFLTCLPSQCPLLQCVLMHLLTVPGLPQSSRDIFLAITAIKTLFKQQVKFKGNTPSFSASQVFNPFSPIAREASKRISHIFLVVQQRAGRRVMHKWLCIALRWETVQQILSQAFLLLHRVCLETDVFRIH